MVAKWEFISSIRIALAVAKGIKISNKDPLYVVDIDSKTFNIDPNLEHYSGIIPCGFRKYGVTSLSDVGVQADISEVAESLKDHFYSIFGLHTN